MDETMPPDMPRRLGSAEPGRTTQAPLGADDEIPMSEVERISAKAALSAAKPAAPWLQRPAFDIGQIPAEYRRGTSHSPTGGPQIGDVIRASMKAERERGVIAQRSLEESEQLIQSQLKRQAQQRQAEQDHKDQMAEYARRSAEASEAALEAERARTAEARADALEAREEARVSRRNMRLSLWIAGGSLLVAAWPFIREALGW